MPLDTYTGLTVVIPESSESRRFVIVFHRSEVSEAKTPRKVPRIIRPFLIILGTWFDKGGGVLAQMSGVCGSYVGLPFCPRIWYRRRYRRDVAGGRGEGILESGGVKCFGVWESELRSKITFSSKKKYNILR